MSGNLKKSNYLCVLFGFPILYLEEAKTLYLVAFNKTDCVLCILLKVFIFNYVTIQFTYNIHQTRHISNNMSKLSASRYPPKQSYKKLSLICSSHWIIGIISQRLLYVLLQNSPHCSLWFSGGIFQTIVASNFSYFIQSQCSFLSDKSDQPFSLILCDVGAHLAPARLHL